MTTPLIIIIFEHLFHNFVQYRKRKFRLFLYGKFSEVKLNVHSLRDENSVEFQMSTLWPINFHFRLYYMKLKHCKCFGCQNEQVLCSAKHSCPGKLRTETVCIDVLKYLNPYAIKYSHYINIRLSHN